MNLGAFGVLAYLKTQIAGQVRLLAQAVRRTRQALARGRPSLLSLFMFSLTGIPGTAGFIGKFYVFNADGPGRSHRGWRSSAWS